MCRQLIQTNRERYQRQVTQTVHDRRQRQVIQLIRGNQTNQLYPPVPVEGTKTLVCALVLSKLDYCNSLLSGCPLNILRRLQKVQSSETKLVFKLRRRDDVQPLLSGLHWLPVQARVDYKLSTICNNFFFDSSHAYLSDLLPVYTPSDNFVLLQTHGHFASKPLASVLSLTLLRSNGILSLLTFVTFSPLMPSTLH